MRLRVFLQLSTLISLLLLIVASAVAQDMNRLKAGVVRIENTTRKSGEVGAGFIVKIDKDRIYIVTASHVVKGNGNPSVYLFNDPLHPLSAVLMNRDDENPKGLALLVLESRSAETLSGLTALTFGNSSKIEGGESVKIVGFPQSTRIWDVSHGIPISEYVINYYRTNPAVKNDMTAFNQFNNVRFAFGLTQGGNHNFLYSKGMVYEVHWGESG